MIWVSIFVIGSVLLLLWFVLIWVFNYGCWVWVILRFGRVFLWLFLMKVSILVNGFVLVLLWLILIWGFNYSFWVRATLNNLHRPDFFYTDSKVNQRFNCSLFFLYSLGTAGFLHSALGTAGFLHWIAAACSVWAAVFLMQLHQLHSLNRLAYVSDVESGNKYMCT